MMMYCNNLNSLRKRKRENVAWNVINPKATFIIVASYSIITIEPSYSITSIKHFENYVNLQKILIKVVYTYKIVFIYYISLFIATGFLPNYNASSFSSV